MTKFIQNNDVIYLVYNSKKQATIIEQDYLTNLSAQELINEVTKCTN